LAGDGKPDQQWNQVHRRGYGEISLYPYDPAHWIIEVKDTGIGISETVLDSSLNLSGEP